MRAEHVKVRTPKNNDFQDSSVHVEHVIGFTNIENDKFDTRTAARLAAKIPLDPWGQMRSGQMQSRKKTSTDVEVTVTRS